MNNPSSNRFYKPALIDSQSIHPWQKLSLSFPTCCSEWVSGRLVGPGSYPALSMVVIALYMGLVIASYMGLGIPAMGGPAMVSLAKDLDRVGEKLLWEVRNWDRDIKIWYGGRTQVSTRGFASRKFFFFLLTPSR